LGGGGGGGCEYFLWCGDVASSEKRGKNERKGQQLLEGIANEVTGSERIRFSKKSIVKSGNRGKKEYRANVLRTKRYRSRRKMSPRGENPMAGHH